MVERGINGERREVEVREKKGKWWRTNLERERGKEGERGRGGVEKVARAATSSSDVS